MRLLFLLFIILPIAELLLLFKVGSLIGALPTIAIVLLTATLGVRILRHQSFSTLRRAQARLQGGELPGQELVEGFLISIGGALLLTPGFITDISAMCLLLPFSRRALVRHLFQSGRIEAWGSGPGAFSFTRFRGSRFSGVGPPQGGPGGRDVFEGEFTREGRSDPSLKGPDQQNDPPQG